ncbi:MAG: TolC family protein, partial [Phycisphaerae bacterium]|nr:TolC family protein [Phycisphaerae bacterium]
MVSEGLSISPAIKDLDSQIKAQNAALRSAKSAFILPDVSVGAEVSHLFSEGGAGQKQDVTELPFISSLDDTDWT